jgi:hypothetical protein
VLADTENAQLKQTLFDVRSRLYRLEASARTNVDPLAPGSGGIGQTLSVLVHRQQSTRPRLGGQQAAGPSGRPLPNWTLRLLDWQKEGGARLFLAGRDDDNDFPGGADPDELLEPRDDVFQLR